MLMSDFDTFIFRTDEDGTVKVLAEENKLKIFVEKQ